MTNRENAMLRNCHKIIDYKLGSDNNQINAVSRQSAIYEKRKLAEESLITHRLKIVTILRNGDLVEIDQKNANQVDVFLKLRNEGLIEISEVEPKKYIAKWRV